MQAIVSIHKGSVAETPLLRKHLKKKLFLQNVEPEWNCIHSTEFKVIALYCIAHPYYARFVASLARAHSARTSRD